MTPPKYQDPSSLSVSAILGLIDAKDIAVPEIQRPFVWKKTQVRDLIDSNSAECRGAVPGICELCGSAATELFPIEMYKIIDSTRILNTTDIRYVTKTVMVPICKCCQDKGSKVMTVYAAVFILLFVAGFVASITVLGLSGFCGICFGGFLALMAAGILSFPFYLFTVENRITSKSKMIKRYADEGWVVGKRPSKADM